MPGGHSLPNDQDALYAYRDAKGYAPEHPLTKVDASR